MIKITSEISLDENELKLEFVRSSGPGGQNVNKVSTAVQLRFDVVNSASLPEEVRSRLLIQSAGRITDKGVLLIDAERFRTQLANRQDAVNRLIEIIQKAASKPAVRHKTRPTLGSKQRRLEFKHRRSAAKSLRSKPPSDAD